MYGGAQVGKVNTEIKKETIVWWSAGGGENLNEEVEWRPLYGGAQWGGKLR